LNPAVLKFDPIQAASGVHQLLEAIYGSLLVKAEDGEYQPGLAERVEVIDPQTIEVELRDGLTFTDGTPVDAEALKFNLERFARSENRLGLRTTYAVDLREVEVTGPLSATVHLSAPTAGTFYDLFAGPEFSLVSPTAVQAGQDLNQEPVGAGPFVLESFEPDRKLVLRKNPDYWNADAVELAGVEYVQVSIGPAVVNALQTGAIDLAPLDFQLGRSVRPPIVVESFPHPSIYSVEVCKKDAPLADRRVRQALAHAIDRESLGERMYGPGNTEPAWGLRRAGAPGYNAALEEVYAYDPDKAAQLLAEAGYADGFSTSMVVTPGLSQVAGELLQAQWGAIGVDLELRPTTNATNDFYLEGRAPMFPIGYTRFGIDTYTVRFLPGAFANVCQYSHPELEEVVRDIMAVAADSPEAAEGWQRMSALVAEDLPIIPLVFHVDMVGYNSDRVGGLTWHLSEFGLRIPTFEGTYIKA